MKDQVKLTAAAARRRTFAAAMSRGAAGSAKSDSTLSPEAASGPATVAGLDNLNASSSASDYGSHAASLVKHAHAHGHRRLASALTSAAHTPHPEDKIQVAQNYLSTLPADVAAQHARMFTPTLLKHGVGK